MAVLRREAEAVLLSAAAVRRPALRRALPPEWLLATDLPQLAEEGTVAAMCSALEQRGWRTHLSGGWLLLDCLPPLPRGAQPQLTGEAACVAELLRRHPSDLQDRAALRQLLKASEQGMSALEKVCAALHRQYAQALRQHQPLPGALLPWLLEILWEVSE